MELQRSLQRKFIETEAAKETVLFANTTVGLANIAVDFEDKQNTRLIGTFQGLPVLTPGTLEFSFVEDRLCFAVVGGDDLSRPR